MKTIEEELGIEQVSEKYWIHFTVYEDDKERYYFSIAEDAEHIVHPKYDYPFFIHKDNWFMYVVSCAICGLKIADGLDREQAVNAFITTIENRHDEFLASQKNRIANLGLSPRYKYINL